MSDYVHQIQNKRVSISEAQPDYTKISPKTIGKTMRHDEVLYVAGIGPKDSGVMFVAQSLEEDEAREVQGMNFGFSVRQPARYLKGDIGTILKDNALSVNLDLEAHYYTAFIKWLLPRTERNKPTKEMVDWATAAFEAEIKECKPKIIVCLGKVPFDFLVEMRINASDALGGWFWSEKYQAKVYLMEKPAVLLFKPERLEQFRLLFREVQKMITHGDAPVSDKDYQVIYDSKQLRELVDKFRTENRTLFAVDCEWGGTTFIDGRLRTLQMCWESGKAAAIRFMDDKGNYVFDVSYEEAGAILGEWLNQPHVKYIGHYVSVDLPWMHRWLHLDWYQKCIMDTAFAMQVVDESAPMGLEWLTMYASNLGRYDMPLLLWKKANPQKEEDGYAFIPDDILLPYSMQDVDSTFQGYLWLRRRMSLEGVTDYYNNIFHPFVTDVFTGFVINGLPVDRNKMEELRKIYHFSYDILVREFRESINAEAKFLLIKKLNELVSNTIAHKLFIELIGIINKAGDFKAFLDNCSDLTAEQRNALIPCLEHLQVAPNFNIRSKPQMVRWLFTVKGHMPIKSTDNKPKGLRALPWEKVLALPPDKQKEYQPASNKQTLQILSEKDPMVDKLFDLNVVGNICNSFLKEAEIDEDTGEVLSENGLFSHLCSDEKIHNFYSTTETGRSRTWKPNVLNWPSYVTKRLASTIGRLMQRLDSDGSIPEEFRKYLPSDDTGIAKVPSIRSCVVAPPGWCIVESDYQTAEIRGLAWLSGDKELMRLLTEPDTTYGLVKDGQDTHKIRISYDPTSISGIVEAKQFAECLNSIWIKGKKVRDVNPDEFLRNSNGSMKHPKYDLHWSLAEMVYEIPREMMLDKVHRQVGKEGNFKTNYGGSEAALEIGILAATGVKPEPGTGKKILDALARRQPRAVEYLGELEVIPRDKGIYVCASGRKRRFRTHKNMSQDNWRAIKSLMSGLGREARNLPMQESVGATAARAGTWLLAAKYANNLQGYQLSILYDAVTTLCPLHEREIWKAAHELYMHRLNSWNYDGRILRYPIDTDLNTAWSEKASGDAKINLNNPEFEKTPVRLLPVLAWFRMQIKQAQ